MNRKSQTLSATYSLPRAARLRWTAVLPLVLLMSCERELTDVADDTGNQPGQDALTEKIPIPIVRIHTPGGIAITSKEIWTDSCTMEIVDRDSSVTDLGYVSLRGRGNSTWEMPKKPYAVKLGAKSEILGMPAHTRWVLLANWMDRTLMRNAVTFEIGRKTKSLEWTPRGQFVELTLNGAPAGNYYLCEQVKIDEGRVNVAKLKADDAGEDTISGGYLFELDVHYDEANKFRTSRRGLPVMFKDPGEDVVGAAHLSYAKSYFDQIEQHLYATPSPDPKYRSLIDIDTFIDWWFVHELVQNDEPCHPKSSYMYKDRDGPLKAGPLWDFDSGTFKEASGGWRVKNAIWYGALFEDPVFVARVKEKWAESRDDFLSVTQFIDSTAERIRESCDRNIQMWPITSRENGDETLTTAEAVMRLKTSYINRIRWMTAAIEGM